MLNQNPRGNIGIDAGVEENEAFKHIENAQFCQRRAVWRFREIDSSKTRTKIAASSGSEKKGRPDCWGRGGTGRWNDLHQRALVLPGARSLGRGHTTSRLGSSPRSMNSLRTCHVRSGDGHGGWTTSDSTPVSKSRCVSVAEGEIGWKGGKGKVHPRGKWDVSEKKRRKVGNN